MFTIGTNCGLRISDIKNLKFENIDWKNNIINYTQQKTKETNELPLTNEIGESLIDYINNERPKCESKYIFITLKPPYTKISNIRNEVDEARDAPLLRSDTAVGSTPHEHSGNGMPNSAAFATERQSLPAKCLA